MNFRLPIIRHVLSVSCLASGLVAGAVKNDYRNLASFPKEATPSKGGFMECRKWNPATDFPMEELNPLVIERVWPKEVGQAVVCLWKDDKTCAFTVTIDDNTKPDHAWWLEQGKKYGFGFTWFAITKPLDDGAGGFNGTWNDFQTLLDAGHDVQSHSHTHLADFSHTVAEDYAASIPSLTKNLKGCRPLTLAYPGHKDTNSVTGWRLHDYAAAAQLYAGARGVTGYFNSPRANWNNVNSVSGANWDVTYPNPAWFQSIRPLLDPNPKSGAYRGWYCTITHGVQRDEQKKVTGTKLIALLDFVKAHESEIWVALFREVILYGQERDTAKLQVTASTPSEIKLVLTDRMYDDWYDYPLTIRVRIPDSWKTVQAAQNKNALRASVVEHEGHRYAMVDVVPDRGEAVITP